MLVSQEIQNPDQSQSFEGGDIIRGTEFEDADMSLQNIFHWCFGSISSVARQNTTKHFKITSKHYRLLGYHHSWFHSVNT